jgi:3-hydroxy-9,10-secoandrosta-1,3,5(10)-triene-9,17-dione monooxygenase reductase component
MRKRKESNGSSQPAISPPPDDSFRQFFRRDARSVAVVTAFGAHGATGSTVTSFCALSADPPLLVVCLMNNSRTLRRMQGTGRFALHLLRSDQVRICDLFAKLQEDKAELFANLKLLAIDGAPVLSDTLAWTVCEIRQSYRDCDHTIVVGSMIRIQCNSGAPLLWQASRQCEVAAASDPLCT